jgi:hypothetical protein
LNHLQVCKDIRNDMQYTECAEKHSELIGEPVSKGTIWRIVSHYGELKHKKDHLSLDWHSGGKRQGWATGRPMGPYSGKYPMGFLSRVDELMTGSIPENPRVLHLFSGAVPKRENEDSMDIQAEMNPTYVHDARETFPIADNTYDMVIADPPYDQIMETKNSKGVVTKTVTIVYGEGMWKTDFIGPYAWVAEACRILKPGGYLLVLHHLVYKTPTETSIRNCPNTRRAVTVSVTTGPNMRVRALCVFEKLPEDWSKDGETGLLAAMNEELEIAEITEHVTALRQRERQQGTEGDIREDFLFEVWNEEGG